jgi:hypothetical protein
MDLTRQSQQPGRLKRNHHRSLTGVIDRPTSTAGSGLLTVTTRLQPTPPPNELDRSENQKIHF